MHTNTLAAVRYCVQLFIHPLPVACITLTTIWLACVQIIHIQVQFVTHSHKHTLSCMLWHQLHLALAVALHKLRYQQLQQHVAACHI
jgi:hypothetical protein